MRALLVIVAFVSCVAHAAQLFEQEADVSADHMELDLRNDLHHLRGNVRIAQGPMSIASEEATASALQTDDSRWTFERSVRLQTADANLASDSATARFAKGQLSDALVKGSPAVFEQRHATADKQARGRAGQIEYDFLNGIVRMTKDVWFSYGGNEFRGNVVVYDVRRERVTVNAEGQNNGPVNITIRPKTATPETPKRNADGNGA